MRAITNWKLAIMAGAACATVMLGGCWPQAYEPPAKVQAVIERTKNTRATYALYSRFRLPQQGGPDQEALAGEFNDGVHHRVETPRNRSVADCAAKTATNLWIETGKTFTGPEQAELACGIDTNPVLTSAEWWGRFPSPYGPVDRIRLTSAEVIRTYDVNPDGVIVHEIIARNAPGRPVVIETTTLELTRNLPPGDIFSEASLNRSVLPDKYKPAPKDTD